MPKNKKNKKSSNDPISITFNKSVICDKDDETFFTDERTSSDDEKTSSDDEKTSLSDFFSVSSQSKTVEKNSLEDIKEFIPNTSSIEDFDIEFEINIEKYHSELYYDLYLIYHDTKYYMSVDENLYESLPNLFKDYPEILKKTILDNQKNLDFFNLKFDCDKIICNCTIDLKLLVQNIDLVFTYKKMSSIDIIQQLSCKLSRARYDIKQLKKNIDDIERKNKTEKWTVCKFIEYLPDEIDIIKQFGYREYGSGSSLGSNYIKLNDKDVYSGLNIGAMNIGKYKNIIQKYYHENNLYFPKYQNIVFSKTDNRCNLSGKIQYSKFSNLLKFPKGVLKFTSKLLQILRFELEWGSNNTIRTNLNFTNKKRKIFPILPEIYLYLIKVETDNSKDYDLYHFVVKSNDINVSKFSNRLSGFGYTFDKIRNSTKNTEKLEEYFKLLKYEFDFSFVNELDDE